MTPAQRQSFVISFTAFLTTLLLLALVSILALIIYRGVAYFWPAPVYSLTFIDEQTEEARSVYAQVFSEYKENNNTVRWNQRFRRITSIIFRSGKRKGARKRVRGLFNWA